MARVNASHVDHAWYFNDTSLLQVGYQAAVLDVTENPCRFAGFEGIDNFGCNTGIGMLTAQRQLITVFEQFF